ncbi:MAG: hypothetical protein AAF724_12825 [Pseudomonadota bacterium]
MEPCSSSQQSEISLDRSRKPRGRCGRLDIDAKEQLLRSYARGEETGRIADRFGIDETAVRKLASRYGVRKGRSVDPGGCDANADHASNRGTHLRAYNKVRRGFDLPAELEGRYVRLLVSGMSRLDAARALGIEDASNNVR